MASDHTKNWHCSACQESGENDQLSPAQLVCDHFVGSSVSQFVICASSVRQLRKEDVVKMEIG